MKKILAMLLAVVLTVQMAMPAWAADAGETGDTAETYTESEKTEASESDESDASEETEPESSAEPTAAPTPAPTATPVPTSGTCGDNLTWTLADGVLTISGAGAMTDYSFAPWYGESADIKSTVIESGVTSIGDSAFYGCSSLTSITIPDGVTSIGNSAFSGCSSLTSVTIPESVTSIGGCAFSGCSSLTSIAIPESVTSIGNNVFSGCSGLTDESGFIIINNRLFEYYGSEETVAIPQGVTSVEAEAFSGCSSLASVTIPDSVTSIGGHAFSGCSSLTSITIPESVTSINSDAFSSCSALTSITIPDSVTSLGAGAFSHCKSLESVTIPDGITIINPYTFSDCSALTSVTIPDSVETIDEFAFQDCTSLTELTLPDGIANIYYGAFKNCSSLKSINIPKNIGNISGCVFSGCTALADENGFIIIDNKLYRYLGAEENISIPQGVTCIVKEAFDSAGITDVAIPDSVTSIESYAFAYCESLKNVNIPESVTGIGNSAFSGCSALTDVYYGGTETEWNAISIGESNTELTGAEIHFAKEEAKSHVTTPEELETALASGIDPVWISGSITLDRDITVPYESTLYLNQGASLCVPSGRALTAEGYIIAFTSTITVEEGGVLDNRCTVQVMDGGELHVRGEYRDSGTGMGFVYSSLSDMADLEAHVTGVPANQIWAMASAASQEQLRSIIDCADSLRHISISYEADEETVLDSNLIIPENVDLSIRSASVVTVPKNVSLTVNGALYVCNTARLNIEYGAILKNCGYFAAQDESMISVAGIFHGDSESEMDVSLGNWTCTGSAYGTVRVLTDVSSTEEMESAVSSGATVARIVGDVTIERTVTVPWRLKLDISQSGASLTIAEGVTFTTYGDISLGLEESCGAITVNGTWKNDSDVSVRNGVITNNGILENEGYIIIQGGKLANNGTYTASESYGTGRLQYNTTDGEWTENVTGIDASEITLLLYPATETELTAAAEKAAEVGSAKITWADGKALTLTENLTIPKGADLIIPEDTVMTVPAGITLTDNGTIYLRNNSRLNVEAGAEFVCNGGISDYYGATVSIAGTLTVGPDCNTTIPYYMWEFTGTKKETGGRLDVYATAGNAQRLETVIDGGATSIQIDESITLENDVAIPENVRVSLCYADLTIPEGKTLTNRGRFYVDDSYGNTAFNVGGTFVNEGSGTAEIGYSALHVTGTIRDLNGGVCTYINVSTMDELEEALLSDADVIYVCGSLTADRSVTVSEQILRIESYASLTIPAEYTLSNYGTIEVYGTLDIQGTFDGNKIKVYSCGTLTPENLPRRDEGTLADTVYLIAPSTLLAGRESFVNCFTGPDNIWNDAVTMEIVSGTDLASIDNDAGILTAGTTPGTIVIRATAQDGSGVTAEKTVEILESEPQYATNLTVSVQTGARGSTISMPVVLESDTALRYITFDVSYDRTRLKFIGVEDGTLTGWHCNNYSRLGTAAWFSDEAMEAAGTVVTLKFRVLDNAPQGFAGIFLTNRSATDTNHTVVDISAVSGGVDVMNYELRPLNVDALVSGKKTTFTLWDLTKNAKATATWSLAEGDNAYASITSAGVLTAKTVDCAHDITVIATVKDSSAVITKTVSIRPKATSVEISLNGTAVSGKMTQDMSERSTLSFIARTYPEDALNGMKWTSSASSVAKVDENGTVTILKPGKTVIKAAAQDGSGKTAQVTLTVTYIDPSSKLTLKAEAVPKIGLQPGQSVQLRLSGTNEIAAENVTFSIPEKQAAIGSVDENGVFTAGSTAGTVTVTAALKGDPLKRKATVSVKVIAMQAEKLDIHYDLYTLTADGEPIIVFDSEEITENKAITLYPEATAYNGTVLDSVKLKWVSKDTSIATVNANGVVTVKKGASGTVAIEATVQDLNKAVGRFWIQVRDYSPRLTAKTVTLNTVLEAGTSVGLVESYGNLITDVALSDARFTASYETGTLTIKTAETVKNGTYKMTLTATCSNERTYDYAITVKTVKTLPTVTVKQVAKFNLFYIDSTAALTITAAGQTIESVELTDCDFIVETDENGTYTIAYADPVNAPVKADTKGTLNIRLAGYTEPVTKAFTVSAVTTAPSVKLSSTSCTVQAMPELDPEMDTVIIRHGYSEHVSLLDKKTGAVMDLSNMYVWTDTEEMSAGISTDNNTIVLTMLKERTVTMNVYVAGDNWLTPTKLTFKFTLASAAPRLKIGTTTLKLSRTFTVKTADTTLGLTQGNVSIAQVTITPNAKEGTKERTNSDKLSLVYSNGVLTASIPDPNNLPVMGSYKFTLSAVLSNGTELPSVVITVKVDLTVPKIKITGSGNFNRYLAGREVLQSTVTLQNAEGYSITGFEDLPEGMSYEDGILTVTLPSENATGGVYKLNPIVKNDTTGKQITLPNQLTFKMTTYYAETLTPKIGTASGGLDTMNPSKTKSYTVAKINNCMHMPESVALEGADADKFHAELDTSGGLTVVRLSLIKGLQYNTKTPYKVQFRFSVCGESALSQVITVLVSQTKLRMKTPATVWLYQSQTQPVNTKLEIQSPVTATIANVQLNTSKTDALFLAAIGGESGLRWYVVKGGVLVCFTPVAAEKLTAGKSYKMVLDVTPENNTSNANPTQVTVTVKVLK